MQFRAVRPVVSRPPPEVDSSDVQAWQKLTIQREQLKSRVSARPEDAATFFRLGEVCKQLDEVDSFLRFARQLAALRADAWLPAAEALEAIDAERAEELLLEVLHLPSVDDRGRAEVCSKLGQLRPQEAEKWYRQAVALDPNSFAALQLAEALGESGRLAEAADLFQAASLKQELTPCQIFQHGEALVLCGSFEEGRRLLRKAAEAHPPLTAMAQSAMALSYLLQQQIDLALDCCQQALRCPTAAANQEALRLARFLQSHCYLRNFSIDAAHDAVTQALQGCDGECPLRESMEAFRNRLEVLRTPPGQPQSLDILRIGDSFDTQTTGAYLHLVMKQWEDAEEILQNALQCDGCCPEALLMQAQLLMRQEQPGEAIEYLQKCLCQSFTLLYSRREQVLVHLLACLCYHRRSASGAGEEARYLEAEASASPRSEGSPFTSPWRASLMRFLTGGLSDPAEGQGEAQRDGGGRRDGQTDRSDAASASRHFLLATEAEPEVKDSLAACADAASLTALLRKRSLALELDAEEAGALLHYANLSATFQGADRGDPSALPKMPALVGTASTAMPASDNPSRQNSETQLPAFGEAASATSATTAPPTVDSIAQVLAPDRLLKFAELHFGELLSRGESTIVQKAHYRHLPVVVKALHYEGSAASSEAVEDMLAEIKILSRLRHPRLVPLVGACLESTQLALVTELAAGGNLHHALHVRRCNFTREACFQLALEFLEGVRYLHSLQPPILHLDLKSMNLVLDAELQHLRICDFGLSRFAGAARRGLGRGGSPRYMAPECFDEQLGPQTEKTDVWSSSCILLEIFGRCQPYAECSNVQQILNMLLVQQLPPPLPEAMEASVKSVIANALQYEALARPQVGQLLLQLQRAAEQPQASKSRFQWIP